MATVMITGGSRGIGAAAVRAFARRGDRVVFLYEKNHQAARQVERETGARGICCDVSDPQAVEAAFAPLEELDILINNAGVAHYGLMSQVSPETWDRVFAVNVKGMYLCANAATPLFLKHHRGCILNVASMWGQVGASCEALYSATKGAVIALTKALAKELGPSGIRVNAVSPGVILTDMVADVEPAVLQELQQENLVGRNGSPEDIAGALVYLAEAEFVSGQVLPVNGGLIV